MGNTESIEREGEDGMKKRQITLADGRYLIFFTFADEAGAGSVEVGAETREPEVESEAEEERRV